MDGHAGEPVARLHVLAEREVGPVRSGERAPGPLLLLLLEDTPGALDQGAVCAVRDRGRLQAQRRVRHQSRHTGEEGPPGGGGAGVGDGGERVGPVGVAELAEGEVVQEGEGGGEGAARGCAAGLVNELILPLWLVDGVGSTNLMLWMETVTSRVGAENLDRRAEARDKATRSAGADSMPI